MYNNNAQFSINMLNCNRNSISKNISVVLKCNQLKFLKQFYNKMENCQGNI